MASPTSDTSIEETTSNVQSKDESNRSRCENADGLQVEKCCVMQQLRLVTGQNTNDTAVWDILEVNDEHEGKMLSLGLSLVVKSTTKGQESQINHANRRKESS